MNQLMYLVCHYCACMIEIPKVHRSSCFGDTDAYHLGSYDMALETKPITVYHDPVDVFF